MQQTNNLKHIQEASRRIETPFYFYDLKFLRNRINKVKEAYQDCNIQINFFYSANKNISILKEIIAQNIGIVFVRPSKFQLLEKLGIQRELMEFSGFGLSEKNIIEVKNSGVHMNLSTENELLWYLKNFSSKPVGLRVNLEPNSLDKRGIPLENFQEVIKKYKSKLILRGIHTYIGSNLSLFEGHEKSLMRLESILKELPKENITNDFYLNLGGGFSYDYIDRSLFDWNSHSKLLRRVANNIKETKPEIKPQFKLEIGRALTVDSGYFVCSILFAYCKDGRNFIVINSNMSHFPRPVRYGFDESVYPFMSDGSHQILIPCTSSGSIEVFVAGNSHYSKDFLGKVFLEKFDPQELENQLLIFLDAGSYCESMMDDWSDEPRPASVVYDDQLNITSEKGEISENYFE